MAIVSYAKDAIVEFFFDDYTTKDQIKQAIDNIVYVGKYVELKWSQDNYFHSFTIKF